MIIDAVLSETDISYSSSKCDIQCNEMLQTDEIDVHLSQLIIECETQSGNNQQYLDLKFPSNSASYTHHLQPNSLQLFINNTSHYPGGLLFIGYSILDKNGNQLSFSGAFTQTQTIPITIKPSNSKQTYDTLLSINIVIDTNGSCDLCQRGISLPMVTLDHIGQEFVIISPSNNITITITPCPLGYAANNGINQCELCPVNTFNFDNGLINSSCHECDTNNDAITCLGDITIMISYHHWATVNTDGNKILSGNCPNGYCCDISNGCNYILDDICASNRDSLISLCGKCKEGYSEILGSAACGKCDEHNSLWLLFPIFLSLMIAVFLIMSKSRRISKIKHNSDDPKMKNKGCFDCFGELRMKKIIKVMCKKVIIYYEQTIFVILISNKYNIILNYLSSFVGLFNLSIEFETAEFGENGFCFLENLSSKDEILVGLIVILMIFATVSIMALCATLCPCTVFDLKSNFPKTFIMLMLLTVSKVFIILFKLLSCQSIDNSNKKVHFYFGFEECYGITWWLSIYPLILIFAMFIALLIAVYYRWKSKVIKNTNHMLNPFIYAYKNKFWYWEFVILLRRVLIIYISIIHYSEFFLLIVLFIFFMLNEYYQPFCYQKVNKLESSLLLSLMLVIVTMSIFREPSNHQIIYVILTILIFMPLFLILWYIYVHMRGKKMKKIELKHKLKWLIICIIMYYYQTVSKKQLLSVNNGNNNSKSKKIEPYKIKKQKKNKKIKKKVKSSRESGIELMKTEKTGKRDKKSNPHSRYKSRSYLETILSDSEYFSQDDADEMTQTKTDRREMKQQQEDTYGTYDPSQRGTTLDLIDDMKPMQYEVSKPNSVRSLTTEDYQRMQSPMSPPSFTDTFYD